MRSFQEFITEGRDAPLYHGCSLRSAKHNLYSNKISALNGRGISLTRNKHFAMSWGPVVFELDQRLLTHNHKIKPYSFFGDPDVNPDKSSRIGRLSSKSLLGKRSHFMDQQEERLVDDIKPLDRYITGIWIDKKILDDAVIHEIDDEFVQTVIKNPKFKDVFDYKGIP